MHSFLYVQMADKLAVYLLLQIYDFFEARINNLMKTKKNKEENKLENVLFSYHEGNSRNEIWAFREDAAAELHVCFSHSVAYDEH